MIRQRALGQAIRRANTTSNSASTSISSTSSVLSPSSLQRLLGGRGAGVSASTTMHFYYGGGTGRSIFTTAAALASAYYMGGLSRAGFGGVAACEAPVLPPPSPPQVIKFPIRRNHTDGGGNGNPAESRAASATTIVPNTALPPGHLTTSVVAFKGQRSYMEDDYFISKDGRFAGVYDGHGGAAVSKYLRQNLQAQFLAALPDEDRAQVGEEQVVGALQQAFQTVDDAVVKVRHWAYMGSTAVVVVLHSDETAAAKAANGGKGKLSIISANVGDSRAVLSRKGKAVELTEDHKPNKPSELDRVKKLGGTVRWYGLLEQDGTPMEGMGVYRINGNLAVARAIGDRSERPFVSSEVDIAKFPVEEGDEFIILATDGLWDVMSSEEAVEFVHNVMSAHVGALTEGGAGSGGGDGAGGEVPGNRPADMKIFDWTAKYSDDRGIIRAAMMARKKKMARYLSEEAFRRGTMDNVTVVVVWLK